MARGCVWVVLVVGVLCGLCVAVLIAPPQVAVVVGIAGVGIWIAWGVYSSWRWSIRHHIAAHLGPGWRKAQILTHKVRTGERVNIHVALDHLLAEMGPGEYLFGFQTYSHIDEGMYAAGGGMSSTSVQSLLQSNVEAVPIRWEPLPLSRTEVHDCADNAVYLIRPGGHACVAAVQGVTHQTRKRAVLQILARDRATARLALEAIQELARQRSVYRGAIISIHKYESKSDDYEVAFHDLAIVPRDAVVLPQDVFQTIERNVLGFFRHADQLKQAGQGIRHGVLLHGPPGTGKTLVTRYLAALAPQRQITVLLLTGRQYAFLKTVCLLARLLAPSLVVLEDVDLIAADRRRNRHTPLLHELMDEMDGLGPIADVVFLLTTNRPEVLESALAARPGRVDQAIYFPLPDLECRTRLFAQYGQGLDLSAVDLQPMLAKTEGASPAFLKEFFRRATLLALERGARGGRLAMRDEDFTLALRELIESGGALTRNFLGFPAPPTDEGRFFHPRPPSPPHPPTPASTSDEGGTEKAPSPHVD